MLNLGKLRLGDDLGRRARNSLGGPGARLPLPAGSAGRPPAGAPRSAGGLGTFVALSHTREPGPQLPLLRRSLPPDPAASQPIQTTHPAGDPFLFGLRGC